VCTDGHLKGLEFERIFIPGYRLAVKASTRVRSAAISALSSVHSCATLRTRAALPEMAIVAASRFSRT